MKEISQLELALDNQDFEEAQRIFTNLEHRIDSKSPLYVEFLIQKSRYFETIDNVDSSESVSRKAIDLALELGYTLGLSRAYCQLAFGLYLTNSSTQISKEQKEVNLQEINFAINEADKILSPLINSLSNTSDLNIIISKTQALIIDYKGILELEKGFINQAIVYFKEAFDLSKKINYNYIIIASLNNLAFCHLKLGEINLASETIEKKIDIIKATGNVKELTLAYAIKGDIYRELGELDKALEIKKLILDLGESLERPFLISFGLANIASVYFDMGEFELAKDYFYKSTAILEEEFGKERHPSRYVNTSLGVIARYEMNYQLSLQYFKSLLHNLVNEIDKIPILFELIITLLEINSLESISESKHLLKSIHELNQKYVDNKVNIDLYNLANAMILNKSPRVEHKYKAKRLLKDIEQSGVRHKHQLLASQAIIDILLYELKASGDKEILFDLKSQIDKLFNLSQNQKRFTVMVDTFLLQSRVEIVEGNYQKAFELLENATQLCQQKHLHGVTKRIEAEKDTLTKYITIFNDQLKDNESIINKIEVVQLEDYLNKAKIYLSDSLDDKKLDNNSF